MRASIVATTNKYDSFIKTDFDGTFFGPVSSAMERATEEAKALGFLEEYVYSELSRPLHYLRRVSPSGRELAETFLTSDSDWRLPISDEDLGEIAANALFLSTTPTSYAVAFSLYSLGKEVVRVTGNRSRPESYYIGAPIEKDTWTRLARIYSRPETWGHFVRIGEPRIEKGNSHVGLVAQLPYAVNPQNVWTRYSHYVPTKQQLENDSEKAAEARSEDKSLEFLLQRIQDTSPSEVVEWRQHMVNRVCSICEHVPDLYCTRMEEMLKVLSSDYDNILRREYDQAQRLIEKLAALSWTTFDDGSEGVLAKARVSGDSTLFETVIPKQIISKFEDWNFGNYYQLGHIMQVEPSSYLVEQGLSDYVESAGIPARA
jgi:hypothetical protein